MTSSTKIVIHTSQAPAAVGPYNQAIVSQGLLFASGQIGLDPKTNELAGADFETQARQAFQNLAAVVAAAGTSLDQAIKFTVFLTDFGNFPIANTLMKEFIPEPFPARSTIGVASLPKGALFEVEGIFAVPSA